MLRLVIVDDERVIRETIHQLIDWNSLGIEVIGLCQDGIEAYNLILDEMPDIVMADIRMPGLTGLELIKKIRELEFSTKFIILSGYEEFEYAREAMKYGIRHYLLKPCDEEQIKNSVLEVAKECQEEKRTLMLSDQQMQMIRTVYHDAMFHVIMEGVSFEKEEEWRNLTELYTQYFDFTYQPYHVRFLYYFEELQLNAFLEELKTMINQNVLPAIFYGIYVKNTLILYGKKQQWPDEIDTVLNRFAGTQSEEVDYDNLLEFIKEIVLKIKRYDTIHVLQEYRMEPIFNHHRQMNRVKQLCQDISIGSETDRDKDLAELKQMVEMTGDLDSLRTLVGNIYINLAMTDLISSVEMVEFVRSANQTAEPESIREQTDQALVKIRDRIQKRSGGYSPLVDQVIGYVREHLDEPNLTLKRISENYLYMNVDYVGRQFQKVTNKKFSQYLTEERIRLAKELLLQDESLKLQYLADQVGCGNNPQYFSQIFKKMVGMTPGNWIKSVK